MTKTSGMNLQVLLSCMHKKEFSIIEKSNLTMVNTLIINQCDENRIIDLDNKHRVINTSTRGLSVSRNLAIQNASEDLCLICDDDEIFVDNLETIITTAYLENPDADIIIFKMFNQGAKFGNQRRKLRKYELMRVASWQVSFRHKSVKNIIEFDPFLGAGTPSGSGEENKFLNECYKKNLNIYYEPVELGYVAQEKSTWFHGYDKDYFYRHGSKIRYIYGLPFALMYNLYFVLTKINMYKKDSSVIDAFRWTLKGIKDNNINKRKLRTYGE